MAVLSALKLVSATRTQVKDPVVQRRNKLVEKLQEQLMMAESKLTGRVYAPTKIRTFVDEAGDRKTIEVPKKVREWFWMGEGGKVNMSIKYGAATLYLNAKNATAIELPSMDELVSVIKSLKVAVLEGEFDKAIESATKATREGFGK
jgi:xanthine dehydrogenase iron-sulfur cluster and FAD-binding subunit A